MLKIKNIVCIKNKFFVNNFCQRVKGICMKNNNKKILGWQISQTKSLLNFINNNKNMSLTTAFSIWAKENFRQAFSVRNYYYKLLDYLKKNPTAGKELEIEERDIDDVLVTKHFSQDKSVWLLEKILPNNPKISVRAKCIELACGDMTKMIRYQNKYRNLVSKNKQLVENVMEKLKNSNVEVRNPFKKEDMQTKILNMPKDKNFIGDEEIQALFNGLIKLVKTNTEKAVNIKNQKENLLKNNALSVALANLRRKNIQIKEFDDENKKLKQDLDRSQQQLYKAKSRNFETMVELKQIVKSKKMEQLKKFISKIESLEKEEIEQPKNK